MALAAAGAIAAAQAQQSAPAGVSAGLAVSEEDASELGTADRAVARTYRFAERDELDAANRFADAALARFPGSAELWKAAGYVRRGAGNYAGALEAYRRAGDLQPTDPDALKGQALMLRKLGAVAPAAALVGAHPELADDPDLRAIPAEQAALELRYADGVESRSERRNRLRQAAAKLDGLIQAAGGQIEAARRGDPAVFDRIQAAVLLQDEADAVARFERLTGAGIDVPAYARYQAAVAYARLRQSVRAIPILQRLVQERPDDVDSQLELFYSLVDTDRLDAARDQIDRLDERLSATADPGDLMRVRIARAMVRAYDEHPAQAVGRLDALLEQAPFSADARSARATVWLWRGWPRRAQAEADAVLTVAPRNSDAHALRIQTDIALDDWRSARAALLSDDAGQALSERDLRELGQRLHWHDRPEIAIDAGYGTGSQTNVATHRDWMIDTRAYSSPIEDRYRLFAHLRDTRTDIAPAALARAWGGAGLEATARSVSGSIELAGVQGEPGPAAVLRTVWQPADGARLTAQAATSDPDTPARASGAGIRERTVQLGSGYDWNESTGVGADFGYGRFTDGNEQLSALLRLSQRLAASSRSKLTWNTYLGYTHDTLSASLAPYFDPARATSEDTELRWEWLGRRDPAAHRAIWHVVTLSAGDYQQGGFGARPDWAVRYELRWSLSEHSELHAGIGRSEHPYDGREEARTAVSIGFEGRL